MAVQVIFVHDRCIKLSSMIYLLLIFLGEIHNFLLSVFWMAAVKTFEIGWVDNKVDKVLIESTVDVADV